MPDVNSPRVVIQGLPPVPLGHHAPGQHTVLLDEEHSEERMNAWLAVILVYLILFLMIGTQAALYVWRKKHQRSYDLATLVGLWLMPPLICVQLHFWRFIVIWAIYSASTGYVLSLCLRKKLELTTPRTVYGWFLATYRISLATGVAGYILLLLEMFGAGPALRLILPRDMAADLIWYGVYFGVLGRDCAEVASDRIAAVMGGSRRILNTANSCGVCGNEIKDYSHLGEQNDKEEACVQLSCKHCFHELCIRGWTVVGKKDTCPVCLEKVDLRALYADRPWETRNLTWIQMLDSIRYMVVWHPLLLFAISIIFHMLGFPDKHHIHHHGHEQMHYAVNASVLGLDLHPHNSSVHHSPGVLALGNQTQGHTTA